MGRSLFSHTYMSFHIRTCVRIAGQGSRTGGGGGKGGVERGGGVGLFWGDTILWCSAVDGPQRCVCVHICAYIYIVHIMCTYIRIYVYATYNEFVCIYICINIYEFSWHGLYVRLYTTIDDYAWLYMTIHECTWLYMTIHDYTWL